MARFAAIKLVLTSTLAPVATGAPPAVNARGDVDGTLASGMPTVHVTERSRPGREIDELIRLGGPFPYDKDGAVFGNRGRQLPIEKRGTDRGYTVTAPGSRDRGARRIVCGGPPGMPHARYYTADHYASFRKIVE